MTFDLHNLLDKDVVFTKRKRLEDPFSIIHGNHIIKGPYTKTKFDLIMDRYKYFFTWKIPVIIFPEDYFITNSRDHYIRIKNLINTPIVASKFSEPFSNLSYNILDKKIFPSIKDFISSNRWLDESTNDLIFALCHCYLLGIGSLNISNIFIDISNKKFCIMDIDATSTCERNGPVFYFNRSPSDKMMWLDKVTHHYNEVANRLEYNNSTTTKTSSNVIKMLRDCAGRKTLNNIILLQPISLELVVTVQPLTINSCNISGIQSTIERYSDVTGIYFFGKKHHFELSNYYVKPDNTYLFKIGDNGFFSSEHAYHFYKFCYNGASKETLAYAEIIRCVNGANYAKKLSKKSDDNVTIDPNWTSNKINTMKAILTNKFIQNDHCQKVLLSTKGRKLYEDSPYDSFWGIGKDGLGSNWLGIILEEVRDKLLDLRGVLKVVHDIIPIKLDKLGGMIWEGLRSKGTKTYSNISFDLARSALQKYICRSMKEKAVLTAIELYRLLEVGGIPGVTNMYNRLAIIANEDIGIANLPLILEITNIVSSGDRDPAKLCAIVQLMSESYKTRIALHAGYAYASWSGRRKAVKAGISIEEELTDLDKQYVESNKNSDLFLCTDPLEIRPYALMFSKRLQEKNYNAFSWLYLYMDAVKDINSLTKRKKFVKKNPKCKTGKPDIILWNALSKIMDPNVHDILVDSYYSFTEGSCFLQSAILVVITNTSYTKINIQPTIDLWKKSITLRQIMNGDFLLTIDAFAVDNTTFVGRTINKTGQPLISNDEVIPLAKGLHHEQLAQIYTK